MNSRLKSELKKLRKKYREETDKAKHEFMNVHSKQVMAVRCPSVSNFNTSDLRAAVHPQSGEKHQQGRGGELEADPGEDRGAEEEVGVQ